MDKRKVERLAEQYAESVVQEYPAEKVVLFGSYAKGTARTHSDIDIAVIVDHIEGDYFDTVKRLFGGNHENRKGHL